MASYYLQYADELHSFFLGAIGTWRGKELPMPEIMDIWIDETRKGALSGNRFFFAGNGASATMAEHMGFDSLQNAHLKTVNFSETSYLTAISNDLSFEDVFLVKLQRFAEEGDTLVTISSSGNSPNVVKALEYARKHGIHTVTLSGMKTDNKSRRLGDLAIWVPATTYGVAESVHSAILHCWLDMYLERYFGGRH
ncbi:SIS domain-containing protein [Desulfovibrio sp. OttesenSCG-928-A18]|nr:SIS domain-containing protein [Desulfovibrio sp. OttesenSCG-928-A18]